MLKALELIGFKSFADKTRFDFPPGITVIVGPNGSGKSNIVDAVKWVLGEQSAKSLRGKDMADVIFKGSGAGGRKGMNTAEATIIFDNADRCLPIDAPEVHVTRRVYRSGEGEYLINQQPSRLKDIRDMFRGTGVGTDAYSLIEQGKVDRLLQASPRDRRAIFEEAAGISRFKAKKIESQRRLERVEQNLLRLSDIVEEVENRLKSVRAQASKARRYRQYSQRLQQLRTHVGLTDWRQLSEQLEAVEAEIDRWHNETSAVSAKTERLEAHSLELESEVERIGELIRKCENRFARNREQIAARESRMEHERTRCRDLEEATRRHRQQLTAMTGRAGDLQQRLDQTRELVSRAESQYAQINCELTQHEHALDEFQRQFNQLRSSNETRRQTYLEQMRAAADLANRVRSSQSQQQSAQGTAQRCRQRLGQLEREHVGYTRRLEVVEQEERQLAARLRELSSRLEGEELEITENRRLVARRQEDLSQLLGRSSGVRERAAVLEELEKNFEGLDAGARQILQLARQDPSGAYAEVRGLVADLLQANVQIAPLVDVALGALAQHIVVDGGNLLARLVDGQLKLDGRLGIVRLDQPLRDDAHLPRVDLTGQAGIIGRVDRLVESHPTAAPLVRRLLGDTWLVEDLARALAVQRQSAAPLRLVTLAGQLLQSNGALQVGPQQRAAGLVARRSELRALRQELQDVERQISAARDELQRLSDNLERQERAARQLADQYKQSSEAHAEQRLSIRSLQDRCRQLQRQRHTEEAELRAAEVQHTQSSHQLRQARQQLQQTEGAIARLEAAIQTDETRIEQIEQQRQLRQQQATQARVELAKSEQQLEALRARKSQFEEDQRERSRAIQESRSQLLQCLQRREQADRRILQNTSEVAELYVRKEQCAQDAVAHLQQRETLAAERAQLASQLQQLRKQIRQLEEQQHQLQLQAGQLRHQRNTLAERLREDYGIEIAQLQLDPTLQDEQHREQIEDEIAGLRRKINNIGAVNMEALNELDELETRFSSLSRQYEDLVQAKQALERIIHKINADSRRLFLETLEAIRANFQTLYRKAFGGGKADIVLEEGVDVLEAGVEIVATPPGKPSFNNSLLSGGEKALTAVSLLLAIFQFQPSPFCVLDEVDAPFDEANIGRFVDVLKEFLGWTKFVIVTHSKKTMTAATTLYGVTMQESGVSKQVSVRFEDVSEDGQISEEAIAREQDQEEGDERGAA